MTHDGRATRGAPRELGVSRSRWRSAAFELARDAMVVLDDDGACVDANAAARELLGVGTSGVAGRSIDEFAPPAVLGAHSRRWPFFLIDGHDEGECELLRADGARVWVEFRLTARIGASRHLAVLREAAGRGTVGSRPLSAAQLSQARSQFLRGMNHDLRTPLHGIVGASGLLAATELSDEQRECLELLVTSTDSLTAVIEEILGLAKMDQDIPAQVGERDRSGSRTKQGAAQVSRRVLVVEDDPSSRLIAVRLLERRGLTVDAVGNGVEAIDALEKATYDAIFMDCELPELDGYATTREIRAREGSARRTTIVAMTANTLPGDAERCRAAGMDFYVAKPLKPAGLDYIIARAIEQAEV